MAYATKTDIQTLIGSFTIPAAYTDEILAASILRAMAKIDSFTGNTWESIERVLYLQGDGTDTLSLMRVTQWAARSIQAIYYRTDITEDFEDLVDSDTYMLSDSRRHIKRTGYANSVSARLGIGSITWDKSAGRNYLVEATFGTLTTPAVITEATVLLVRNEISPGHVDEWLPMYSERFPDGYSFVRKSSSNVQKLSTGRGNITTGHQFVDGMLAPYVTILPMVAIGF